MVRKTGDFSMMSAAYREVSTARPRLVCDTPGACLRYYLVPGTQLACYHRHASGICELDLVCV